jgi:hypothetical protein
MAGPMTDVAGIVGLGGADVLTTPTSQAPRTPAAHSSFTKVLGERAGPTEASPAGVGPLRRADVSRARNGPASPPSARRAREVLVHLVEGQRRLDELVRAALGGRSFTVQELIAIQAAVLRYTQEIEVVSRVVDRLTSAVKTTLQTQV